MAFPTSAPKENPPNIQQTNGSDIWKTRTEGILDAAIEFFTDNQTGVFVEMACETLNPPTCNTDMLSFKAYLSRWMAAATQMAPFIYPKVMAALKKSAAAAALQCSGGQNGRMCGLMWTKGATWDGSSGVGQQMAALEVIISTQISQVKGPVTNSTGGTSLGNSNAGAGSTGTAAGLTESPTTTGDRAGAGILTALMLVSMIGGCGWMLID
jgi:mannan endo-1,6-alpha-mannosidase